MQKNAYLKAKDNSPKVDELMYKIQEASDKGMTCIIIVQLVSVETKKALMEQGFLLTYVENNFTHDNDLKIVWRV